MQRTLKFEKDPQLSALMMFKAASYPNRVG